MRVSPTGRAGSSDVGSELESLALQAAMARTLSGANRQKLFASFSRKRRPSAFACVSLKAGRYYYAAFAIEAFNSVVNDEKTDILALLLVRARPPTIPLPEP
jgi:hypothetical protein